MKNKIEKLELTSEELSLYTLSPCQRQVLALVIKGYENKEIADILYKTSHTVKAQIAEILRKTKIKNRTQLAYIVGGLIVKTDFFESDYYIKPKSISKLQSFHNLQDKANELL